jgi:hypothetical protein
MRMILPRLIMRSIVGILRGVVPPHAQKIIDQVNTRGLRDLRPDTSSVR